MRRLRSSHPLFAPALTGHGAATAPHAPVARHLLWWPCVWFGGTEVAAHATAVGHVISPKVAEDVRSLRCGGPLVPWVHEWVRARGCDRPETTVTSATAVRLSVTAARGGGMKRSRPATQRSLSRKPRMRSSAPRARPPHRHNTTPTSPSGGGGGRAPIRDSAESRPAAVPVWGLAGRGVRAADLG